MKNLKKTILLILSICFITSCTPSEDGDGNNAPTAFSSNTIELATRGATIIWTESTDFDDDLVTYTVVLEGEEVASGISALTYKFTDLEPETIYNGFIEAKDGKGGVTKADFTFATEGLLLYKWKDLIEGIGYSIIGYFEVLERSGATKYQVVITKYHATIPATVGRTYTWTPDDDLPTGDDFFTGVVTEFTPGVYHAGVNLSGGGNNPDTINNFRNHYNSIIGEAEITITF